MSYKYDPISKMLIKTNDMPLSFKSNLNKAALKSNVKNVISQPQNQNFVSSLMSNLASINADHVEWNKYYDKNMFNDYPNLKSICKNLCSEYIGILNQIDAKGLKVSKELNRALGRCLLNLDADMSNIFR